jgi:pSer/pThr/pTyr-binding forkhead associated (FHA) protein
LIGSAAVLDVEHAAICGRGVDRADMTATCTLTVISGPAAGREIEVEHELIIGRRDVDLAIADEELSRRHAVVRPSESGVVIEDLGSLNGTFVNGARIDAPVTLTADATLRVGVSEMSLRVTLAEPEPEPSQEQGDDTGRTRVATAVAPEPAPIPQPQVTRVREVPAEGPQAPATIPQPQVTRVREVPDEALAPVAIPQPQVTRVREVPAEGPQAPATIPQPQVTRVREVPDEALAPVAIPQPQVTRVRAVAPGEDAAPAESPAPPGGEGRSAREGLFKRLLGRIRGRGGNDEGAAT